MRLDGTSQPRRVRVYIDEHDQRGREFWKYLHRVSFARSLTLVGSESPTRAELIISEKVLKSQLSQGYRPREVVSQALLPTHVNLAKSIREELDAAEIGVFTYPFDDAAAIECFYMIGQGKRVFILCDRSLCVPVHLQWCYCLCWDVETAIEHLEGAVKTIQKSTYVKVSNHVRKPPKRHPKQEGDVQPTRE